MTKSIAEHYRRVEELPTASLIPQPRNARTHSRKQIRQIADSIKLFGFTNPVLIDERKAILAGHGRVEAAKLLRLPTVPCLWIDHMTADEKRAYVLADNKLALNAGWDEEILSLELQGLIEADLDFDIGVVGFDPVEIDLLVAETGPEDKHDPRDDALPAMQPEAPVTRLGDIWICGGHRIICGNSLEAETYDRLMEGARAQMVITDPPYNVKINGHVSGLGRTRHREFAMASGEMDRAHFTEFLRTAFTHMARHSIDGSIHFIFMDWRHLHEILVAGEGVFTELKNLVVWAKNVGAMGSFYRSRHELVFVFKNVTAPHINNFELGQNGRYRTNVWEYRGLNSPGGDRLEQLALHPTVKPAQMLADAMLDCSTRGGLVLDPFSGSGSTLIAAHKTGRVARLVELDPVYVDRTVRRWQEFAHDDAINAATGRTFDEHAVALAMANRDETESPSDAGDIPENRAGEGDAS